jgi:UDP-N-acetylglucosamine transferase subunit ALG13
VIFVTVSTGHFDALIGSCCALSHKYEFYGQVGSSTVLTNFPSVRTLAPAALEKKMAEAELVISHAGTGMLSLLYRLRKPTVIVPKQTRYGESNDGQVELAKKWADLGMGVLCMDVEELDRAIQVCRQRHFEYPVFPSLGIRLRQHLFS